MKTPTKSPRLAVGACLDCDATGSNGLTKCPRCNGRGVCTWEVSAEDLEKLKPFKFKGLRR